MRVWLLALAACHGSSSSPREAPNTPQPGSAVASVESRDAVLKDLRAFQAELTIKWAHPDALLKWHTTRVEQGEPKAVELASAFMKGYRDYLAIDGVRFPDTLMSAFDSMCDAGDLPACDHYGSLITQGGFTAKDAERAVPYMKRACEGGFLHACFSWGTTIWDTERTTAERLLLRACDEGKDGSACGWLSAALGQQPDVQVRALGYDKRGCELDAGNVCATLGMRYRNGWGTKKDPALAQSSFQRSCDLHHGLGCMELASDLEKAGGDAAEIKELRVRGCTLDWAESNCKGLIEKPATR